MAPKTQLTLEQITISSASLGEPNALPPLRSLRYIADEVEVDDSVSDEARKYLGYGCDTPCLPYDELNGYGRVRNEATHRVAVLENEHLRATFLLDLGGRLWSLVHKQTGRELLYVNRVFQPTNQAVRNAWFSGGVEWNVSLRGHGPMTCAPMFAQEQRGDDGSPWLRMFEFERVRRVPFVVDCSLPAGSEFLRVQVHLWNPHSQTIPMYWWSNIAVPEKQGTRVLVPADHAYRYAYKDCMTRRAIPVVEGRDISYATNVARPADYFFDIPEGRRPWIAALDGEGRGLVQTSTLRQRGRKMFAWGTGKGGRRWQRFLTEGKATYLEIQAGLAQTQYECLPMPSGSHWTWVEAYGLMQADRSVVHGNDWSAAWGHVDRRLESSLPVDELNQQMRRPMIPLEQPPVKMLHRATGWGPLEARVLAQQEEDNHPTRRLFGRLQISDEQQCWLQLLEAGRFPSRDFRNPPGGWMVGAPWRSLLETASGEPKSDHWATWFHLGMVAYHEGDKSAARRCWEKSIEREENAWAVRNLAVLESDAGRHYQACDLLNTAHLLLPGERNIALEYAAALLESGQWTLLMEWLDQLELVEGGIREPRLQLARARAQLGLGLLDSVEAFLQSGFELPDLREGDNVLTDLWAQVMTQRGNRPNELPPPDSLDFRMQ